jgi:hypothetical protein
MARSTVSLRDLLEHGRRLFTAVWTIQEGGGRPLTKGTGNPLSDPLSDSNPGGERLEFPRNFNHISAPDANSCAGRHNVPFGSPEEAATSWPTSSSSASA